MVFFVVDVDVVLCEGMEVGNGDGAFCTIN